MAKPLGEVIDLKPGSNFGGGASGGTINIKSNFVISQQQGESYELRYNPYNGVMVLFQETKGENGVIFESRPDGKTDFTDQGYNLLNTGVITLPGSTDPITSQELYNSLINEAKVASKNAKIKNTEGKQINGISPPIAKADPKVIPQTAVVEETNEPEKTDDEESKDNNSSILDKANDLVEAVISKIETQILGDGIKLDDFLLKDNLDVKFGGADDAIRGPFKYPQDAIYDKSDFTQDYIQIVQYSYQPPYKDNIFKKGGAVEILTKGSKRTSPLKKYIGMVKLPMPNSISDSNSVNWGEDQMNDLNTAILNSFASAPRDVLKSAAVGGAASALGLGGAGRLATFLALLKNAGGAQGIQDIVKGSGSGALIQSAVSSRVLAMAGIQVSPESILARGFGVVPNSNMELLFNSPTLRSFQFSWKLSPRDSNEVKVVNKIVRFFKQGMAVKKQTGTSGAGGRSLFLGTPNIFKLNFKTQGGTDISGVNKIKACAIKSCSVNYTPEQIWASYERGQPVSIQISLTVQELEPIYDTDYQEITGGTGSRLFTGTETSTGDLDSISPNDVGY